MLYEVITGWPDGVRAFVFTMFSEVGGSAPTARTRARPKGQPVITSYSIHYTKLYEPEAAPRQAAVPDHEARLVEARNQEDAESPQGMFWEEDVEETLVRYGRLMGYRITSYNVCYTKLLRSRRTLRSSTPVVA